MNRAQELPCDECSAVKSRGGGRWAIDPPEYYCSEPVCPVDVACLRELEALIEVSAHYIAEVLRIHSQPNGTALVDELIDEIACTLEDHFCHGARVGYKAIERAMRRSAHVAVMTKAWTPEEKAS